MAREARKPNPRRRATAARTEIESRLAQSEAQLRRIFENAPIAVALCRLNGRIRRVNPEASTMFGYPQSELENISYNRLVHPDHRRESRDLFRDLTEGETARVVLEKRFVRKDRQVVFGLLHASLIPGGVGHPAEILLQIVDQTPQVRAKDEARQHRERLAHVDRLATISEMAAGIAHEINQPLTAISAFAQACRRMLATAGDVGPSGRDPELDEDLRDALEQISAQAMRAGEVIRRMKGFVRKRESHRELIDVNELVGEVVKLAEADARIHERSIRVERARELLPAMIDPVQIQQVILNLIRNGMEAMHEASDTGEDVVIQTRKTEEEIEVAVVDRGTGLAEDYDRELFNPFFTTKKAGLGMGLSISRSIILAHHGRLWFTRNKDRGMTFRFTLPLAMDIDLKRRQDANGREEHGGWNPS